MNLIKNARPIAYYYTGLSVIAGPMTPIAIISLSPGGGDCYDPAWASVPGVHNINDRAAIIQHYERMAQLPAALLCGVGLIILFLLILHFWKYKQLSKTLSPAILVSLMVAGYSFVIWTLNEQPCT